MSLEGLGVVSKSGADGAELVLLFVTSEWS